MEQKTRNVEGIENLRRVLSDDTVRVLFRPPVIRTAEGNYIAKLKLSLNPEKCEEKKDHGHTEI